MEIEEMINIMQRKKNYDQSSDKNHVACCFPCKGNVLSIGQNYYPVNYDCEKKNSIHAEHDTINKLPFTKKPKKINMLVIRITKNGKLGMSKPCNKCVSYMIHLFPKKGYIVKNIYYSTNEGCIIKTNLRKLSTTE